MIQFTPHGRTAEVNIAGSVGQQRHYSARQFVRLANLAQNDQAGELSLYEEIDENYGIGAAQFASDLKALGPVDSITLRVNSNGGDVFSGFAMFNLLAQHPAEITVCVDGIAASAASYVAMAASPGRLFMGDASRMMIHDASGLVYGSADELRTVANVLQSLSNTIAQIYSNRSGKSRATFLDLMAAETWFTSQEAISIGLADKITPQQARGSSRRDVQSRLSQIQRDDSTYLDRHAVAARLRQIDRDAVAVGSTWH